jgi:hypothetical protein
MGDVERNDCLRTNGGVFGSGERGGASERGSVCVCVSERERGGEERGEEKYIFISNSKWVANAIQKIQVACDICDTTKTVEKIFMRWVQWHQ